MTLEELALEYRESANLLERRLAWIREQLREARGEAALDLTRRYELMRAELYDARKVMGYLNDYYR